MSTAGRFKLLAAAAVVMTLGLAGCGGDNGANSSEGEGGGGGGGGSNCGTNFKIEKIGNQTWMAENLNCDVQGSKCYENSADSCAKYGRLYTWEAAKKACPSGWHLPSDAEWTTLTDFVGLKEGAKLKSKTGWNNDGNGTDEFGFSALPGGYGYNSFFNDVGYRGDWWSVTESGAGDVYCRDMFYSFDGVNRYVNDKTYLYSVRCVKN